VKLTVFNTLGQFVVQLRDELQSAGSYTVLWNGTNMSGANVATGLYIFRMQAGDFIDTKKMLLLK